MTGGGAARRALVTRPREDAHSVSQALRQRGWAPLLEPLLEIEPIPVDLPSRHGLQGLLITSANGVRALAAQLGDARAQWRDLPLWAVGDRSATAARQQGFIRVTSAGGDVASLTDLLRRDADPTAGQLLHIAGEQVAGDLAGSLAGAGFSVARLSLYRAVPAAALSPPTVTALRQGRVAVALFFSPRTAATFVRLALAQQLADACQVVRAACLSPAVAAALAGLVWRDLRVAPEPRQESLLAALDGE